MSSLSHVLVSTLSLFNRAKNRRTLGLLIFDPSRLNSSKLPIVNIYNGRCIVESIGYLL